VCQPRSAQVRFHMKCSDLGLCGLCLVMASMSCTKVKTVKREMENGSDETHHLALQLRRW